MATHEADVRRAAELIRSSKNVIVLTGAGLSTGLGIPGEKQRENGSWGDEDLALCDLVWVLEMRSFRLSHDLQGPRLQLHS